MMNGTVDDVLLKQMMNQDSIGPWSNISLGKIAELHMKKLGFNDKLHH